MQTWALIADSFRESLDRKIFWVMLIIEGIVAAAMFCITFQPDQVDILFGTWVIKTDIFGAGGELRTDFLTSVLVEWIGDSVLGSVGIFLAIIATAGFIPSLLDRGTVELVASKPLPRWKLFLGRYLGSLSFILVHATLFVSVTFLIAGSRWGVWVPRYLIIIPLMVVLFSYLYCISALVGTFTRSTIASILVTIIVWIGIVGVQSTGDYFEMFPEWKEYSTAYRATQAIRWSIPKTQDITLLARKWTRAADPTTMMPDDHASAHDMIGRARRAEMARLQIPPVYTIGSSLLFEAVILLLALWKFSRSDY